MIAYLLFVGVLYGRQRRWTAAIGWILLVGGIEGLSAGLGHAFPWGGLALIFISATGALLLLIELAARREETESRH